MEEGSSIIYFYSKESTFIKKEHTVFSNFQPCYFKDDKGEEWKSSEHYYQAHKFDNFQDGELFKEAYNVIKSAETANKCKKLAEIKQSELNDRWQKSKWENDHYKDIIMRKALMFKYSQNLEYLKTLINTGSNKLIERSESDAYWGGLIPNSKNMLGNMLMELRDNFNKNKYVYIEGSGLKPIKVDI